MLVRESTTASSSAVRSIDHTPGHRLLDALFRLLEQHHRTVVLTLILGAAIAGAGYVAWLGDVIRFPDERSYLTLAENLAFRNLFSYDGVVPTTLHSPGWPLFLAPWVRLELNVTGLHVVTMLLYVGTLWATWKLILRAAGPIAGALTVLLLLAYPVLFFTGTTLYAQTFGALLFLLGLLLITGPQSSSVWAYLLAGLLYGWLVLAIPMFLPSVLVVAAWRLWPISRTRTVRVAALVAMVGVVVSLWMVRNYVHTGRLVFVASYAGQALLIGNSAAASAGGGGHTDIGAFDSVANRLSETERQQYYRQEALRWFAEHPSQALKLYASKVLYWFSPINRLVQANEQTAARNLIMILSYCPLLLLFLARLVRFRRYPLQSWEVLVYLLYLQSALCYAVFFPRIRYRLPYDYLLIGVVGAYLWASWNFHRQRAAALTRWSGRAPDTVASVPATPG